MFKYYTTSIILLCSVFVDVVLVKEKKRDGRYIYKENKYSKVVREKHIPLVASR